MRSFADQVCDQFSLSFDANGSTTLSCDSWNRSHLICHLLRHVNPARDSSRLHARGDIHCVTPNVILGFIAADDACDHWSECDPDPQFEVLKCVSVYRLYHFIQSHGEVNHRDRIHSSFVL